MVGSKGSFQGPSWNMFRFQPILSYYFPLTLRQIKAFLLIALVSQHNAALLPAQAPCLARNFNLLLETRNYTVLWSPSTLLL